MLTVTIKIFGGGSSFVMSFKKCFTSVKSLSSPAGFA